jgi:hypothetical protein
MTSTFGCPSIKASIAIHSLKGVASFSPPGEH